MRCRLCSKKIKNGTKRNFSLNKISAFQFKTLKTIDAIVYKKKYSDDTEIIKTMARNCKRTNSIR